MPRLCWFTCSIPADPQSGSAARAGICWAMAERTLARVPALARARDAEVVSRHVRGAGGPGGWRRGAGRHLLRHGPTHAARERMQAAGRAEAGRILAHAAQQAASWGAARVET